VKRARFEQQNRADWDELEHFVDEMDSNRLPADPERLPSVFRKVCGDLALAQHRMYGSDLTGKLNHIVIRGYNHLYAGLGGGLSRALRWAAVDFPAAIRREWRLFWLCSAMFWVPFFGMLLAAYIAPEWVEAVLGPESRRMIEIGFGPGSELSDYRDEFGSNFAMFGMYIWNNIGIDFRIFAGGILFCLGTIFFLVFNGVHIGASTGYAHMLHDGAWPEPFYNFVSGHSSFELLAMIIAGIAGMRIGLAVLRPGRLSRGKALAREGKRALPLICGAAMMTFVAAIIEGFWSAQEMPSVVKYAVGLTFWAVLTAYFLLAGRGASVEA
jgi:uncharacterized membrane protein SpoIIM required for sporulation